MEKDTLSTRPENLDMYNSISSGNCERMLDDIFRMLLLLRTFCVVNSGHCLKG